MDIKTNLQKGQQVIQANSPAILTAAGCSGVVSTAALAILATPKAHYIWVDIKQEDDTKTKMVRTVKEVLPCYIPTLLSGALTISAIVGSHKVLTRRNAALASLYAVSEKTLSTYQQKVIDKIGEKQEREIRSEVNSDIIKHNSPTVIYGGAKGQLCYDSFSGRYFRSDINEIEKAVNDVNAQIWREMQTSLNDFYYQIGLEPIMVGDEMGWSTDTGNMQVSFDAQITEDDEPAIVVEYKPEPFRY